MTLAHDDPYEALAEVIERELELVARRDFAGLAELKRRRAAVVRSLPPAPPESARATLERCLLLHKRVTVELARVREALLLELRQVRHAQQAAAGYRPPLRHGPRISASA